MVVCCIYLVCSKCQGYVYWFLYHSCILNIYHWMRKAAGFGFLFFCAEDHGFSTIVPGDFWRVALPSQLFRVLLYMLVPVLCPIQTHGTSSWSMGVVWHVVLTVLLSRSDLFNGLQKVRVLCFSCSFQGTWVLGGFECYEIIWNCWVWPNAAAVHTFLPQLQLQLLHGLEILLQGPLWLERVLWGT